MQIVAEKQGTAKSAGKSMIGNSGGSTLTEEMLAEHNRLNGTIGCSGAGTFNNHTKEYICKWATQNTALMTPRDEKPFAPGIIPIETYGVKVLDSPQYLVQQGSSSSSSPSVAANKPVNGKSVLTVAASAVLASKPTLSQPVKVVQSAEIVNENGVTNGSVKSELNHQLAVGKVNVAAAAEAAANVGQENSKTNGKSKQLIKTKIEASTNTTTTNSSSKKKPKLLNTAAGALKGTIKKTELLTC